MKKQKQTQSMYLSLTLLAVAALLILILNPPSAVSASDQPQSPQPQTSLNQSSPTQSPQNQSPQNQSPQNNASPVLVELFTSEGCSSCPPADALLRKLDSMQPISGENAIVLSEHVDYWNHDGWIDSYSSSFFTDRQQSYARRLREKEPYTPQMVIDGAAQMNGANAPAVAQALQSARSHGKIPVRISSVAVANPKALRVHIEVEPLPADSKANKADIFVAVALDHAESRVSGGENNGRSIQHVAVAESMTKVGTIEKGKNFDREVTVKVPTKIDAANLRVIAFVQEGDGGEVRGAAQLSAPLKVSLLDNAAQTAAGSVGR
jgi:hypothetical protein